MLRKQLVRRLPTEDDLDRRAGLRLMARDEAMLEAIGAHRLVTTDLLELAFFPTSPESRARRGAPSSRAYERLRLLWLWGYVERIERPVARGVGGQLAYLYTLSRKGVAHVARRGAPGLHAPGPLRLDRLDDSFLEHNLLVAGVWARLEAQVGTGALRRCRWVPEPELRARRTRVRDPRSGRSLPVLPDGYAELEHADGTVRQCLVEVDMGTLTLGRFRRKVRALQLYLDGSPARSDWGHAACDVVVLTGSWKRLRGLWKAARQEVPSRDWSRYLFATDEALHAGASADSTAWLTLAGEYVAWPRSPHEPRTG